jgi:hypothetical protein
MNKRSTGPDFRISQIRQSILPLAGEMPRLPRPFRQRDWQATSLEYYRRILNLPTAGGSDSLGWIDEVPRNGVGLGFGMATALGDPRMGPWFGKGEVHEAINTLGAMIGATLCGHDLRDIAGLNLVAMAQKYFGRDSGWEVFMNFTCEEAAAAGGMKYGGDFWYVVEPNSLFFWLSCLYPDQPKAKELIASAADRWLAALDRLEGDFNVASFDFALMRSVIRPSSAFEHGSWSQPDAAGGIGFLLLLAYEMLGDRRYLDGSREALRSLVNCQRNPLYEDQLFFGLYAAARMNAHHGENLDVGKLMGWCFDPDADTPHRGQNWGMMRERWGNHDVHGLIGSRGDGGGYAFVMNTICAISLILPTVCYHPEWAKIAGRWSRCAINALRFFYPDEIPLENQTCYRDGPRTGFSIAYEGLMRSYRGVEPMALGDPCTLQRWKRKDFPSDLSLYGSSRIGMIAALARPSSDPEILLVNCVATDPLASKEQPVLLCYNAASETRRFALMELPPRARVVCAFSKEEQVADEAGRCEVMLAPDSAGLFVVASSETKLVIDSDGIFRDGTLAVRLPRHR